MENRTRFFSSAASAESTSISDDGGGGGGCWLASFDITGRLRSASELPVVSGTI
jgi:hypothetical protein